MFSDMIKIKLLFYAWVCINCWIVPVIGSAEGDLAVGQCGGFENDGQCEGFENDGIKVGPIVEMNSDNSNIPAGTGTVYIDNLHNSFSYLIFDLKPLIPVVQGIAREYSTIVLDCFPIIRSFPPGPDDNFYFHFAQAAAKRNNKTAGKKQPVQLWLHPHLHIPYLEFEEKDDPFLKKAKPIDIARFMAHQANDVHPDTVTGVLITTTPLLIPEYRKKLRRYKKRLTKEGLKFGLIIDNWDICGKVQDKFPDDALIKLFSKFDTFYFHQPQNLQESEKTGKSLNDAVLEGKLFDGLFKTCEEFVREYLPEGKKLEPIRGYFRAKFDKDDEQSKMKFKFDVVRV